MGEVDFNLALDAVQPQVDFQEPGAEFDTLDDSEGALAYIESISDEILEDTDRTARSIGNIIVTCGKFMLDAVRYFRLITLIKGCFFIIFLAFVLYPVILHAIKAVRATCKPVMFSYQHVLITGCGTGLGRSLV